MRRLALAVVLLASLCVPPGGLADADPASDFLLTEDVFLPFDANIDEDVVERLYAVIREAKQEGFPIRVALIARRSDLGGVPALYGKPQRYSEFLGQELRFVYQDGLLVVMPNGYGYSQAGQAHPFLADSLSSLPAPGRDPTDMAKSATTAVERLAAGAGSPLPSAGSEGGGLSAGRAIAVAAAVALPLVLIAGAVLLLRRRRRQRKAAWVPSLVCARVYRSRTTPLLSTNRGNLMIRFGASASAVVIAIVLASFASTARAAEPAAQAAGPAVGSVDVSFVLNRFVRAGKSLVARGESVATFTAADGQTTVVRQPMSATVVLPAKWLRSTSAANRICQVLSLRIDPLRLNLLGLIVEIPEPVTLTITANSRGGILGSLLCSLANRGLSARGLSSAAAKLTSAVRKTGLATSGASFAVPLTPQSAGAAQAICNVLELTLGPLDLNVLGLRVQLSKVHLRITADSTGGLLGSLLCGLAGGTGGLLPITPPPTP